VKGAWTCPPAPPCNPCPSARPECKCGTPTCDATARAWECPRSCAAFACGTTTCAQGSICLDQPPGIAFPDGGTPADSYECVSIPAACTATPDCACVTKAINGSNCRVASCTEKDGNVFVGCIGA
jgi:hypothetical protein